MAASRFLAPLALIACTEATPPGPTPDEIALRESQQEEASKLFQNNDAEVRGKILASMRTEGFQDGQKACDEALDNARVEKGDQAALPFDCSYETEANGEKVEISQTLHRKTHEGYNEYGEFTGEHSVVQNTITMVYEDAEGRFLYTFEPANMAATENGTAGSLTVTVQAPSMEKPHMTLDYVNVYHPSVSGEKHGELNPDQEDFLRLVKNQTYLSIQTPVENIKADRALATQIEALAPEVSEALKATERCRKDFFAQLKEWRTPNDRFIEEAFECTETYTTASKNELAVRWKAYYVEEEGIQNVDVFVTQPQGDATFEWGFGVKRGQVFDYERISVESGNGSWEYETGVIHRDTLDNFSGPYTRGEKTDWAEGLLDDFLEGGEKYGLRYPDFQVGQYRAPKGSKVTRTFVGPFKDKSVIVLPDLHLDPDSTREQNLSAQKVQDHQAAVLKDLATKYGPFDLVLENIPAGTPQASLATMYEFTPPIQGEFVPSAAQFLAYNPYTARVIGPVSHQELAATMAHLEESKKVSHALAHPWGTPCENAPNFNLAQAIEASNGTTVVPELKVCFCANVKWTQQEAAWMNQDRLIDAPHREAQAALRSPSALTVIIAGKNHQAKIEEELRIGGASYAVVEPTAVRLTTSTYGGLEDPNGLCK